ncbi:arylsulfatase B [Trichonephila clavata]|uniref:Arylsulfatase B n=1 Tax=Trichonephila clavata TaxID=2740835 RepID=A0A8X6HRJ5_TRICU|nr:arylsulfatase B [Trichonephila clavata]
MNLLLLIPFLLLDVTYLKAQENKQQPNIVLIYADDLGHNDVSYNGFPQIPTPNIDALALNGVIIRNYYGEWLCTPSRGSLFTGKYASRLGLHHSVIKGGEDSGLPLDEITLAQRLKTLGYDTHMIGKWHLGYSTKERLPTFRGFDSFFGYLNGLIGYYDHTYYQKTDIPSNPIFFGKDLYNGSKPVKGRDGEYATHIFTEQAEHVILSHDTSKPLFMYMAHLAAHTGNFYKPMEAPPETVRKFKYIEHVNRRIYAGVLSELDDSVGAVFKALEKKNMLENTVVIFVSDNGGEVDPEIGFGSNFPLRGNKMTLWEGSLHLPALIWSPLLNLDESRVSNQFMHVTDWMPTLYNLAGGNIDDLGPIDGNDMWDSLIQDSPSPRTHALLNLDPILGTSSFRSGDMKLVNGTVATNFNLWLYPEGIEAFDFPASYDWVFKNGSIVRDILMENGMWIAQNPDETYQKIPVNCPKPPPDYAYNCKPEIKPCLFNITADPCEYSDLADAYPELVSEMLNIINLYQAESVPPQSKPISPLADPLCHNFMYVPWKDPEFYNACDYTS